MTGNIIIENHQGRAVEIHIEGIIGTPDLFVTHYDTGDAGYPPLVTPTSQIVGTQAVFNVILGERYKMVTKEFKGLVHGDYGKTPAPISPEFTKQILGDEQPITCRPADLLEPEIEKLKAEASKYVMQEEDVLTYAMFPQVAPKFFEKRNAKAQGVDADHADFANKSHPV